MDKRAARRNFALIVMVHIFITVKPSTRLPGKNARLAGYTIAWLAMELLYSTEPVRVYTVGARSELPARLPTNWQHIECLTGTHRGDIEQAERAAAPAVGDVCVLVQLTQPLRRCGLLADVVEQTRSHGCAVTVCNGRQDDWRTILPGGRWKQTKGQRVALHDGALYGWLPGKAAAIFCATAEHGVVINYAGQPVDVDEAADIPCCLAGAWAEMLLRGY